MSVMELASMSTSNGCTTFSESDFDHSVSPPSTNANGGMYNSESSKAVTT